MNPPNNKSSNIRIVAHLLAKKGQEKIVLETLMSCVNPSRAEPGNIMYGVHIDQNEPRLFVVVEHWESLAVRENHLQTDHFKKMQQTVDGEERLDEHFFNILYPVYDWQEIISTDKN